MTKYKKTFEITIFIKDFFDGLDAKELKEMIKVAYQAKLSKIKVEVKEVKN